MAWIADANLPSVAIWAAIVLSGLATGTQLSRWSDPDRGVSRQMEKLLLAGAAAGVVAWCATAGSLAGSSSAHDLLTAYVPIDVGPGFRLAVLWATVPGAALTFAAIILVWAALAGQGGGSSDLDRSRFASVTSATAFIALGLSAWFTPGNSAGAAEIPPFVQSVPAALAPLFALLAVVGVAVITALAMANRSAIELPRVALLGTWVAATAAVVSEQMARSQLGIGPRDAVVLGSASSGLILWLVTSAFLHRRVQGLLLRVRPGSENADRSRRARYAAQAGHAGAVCLAVSFAAHAFASRSTISLPPGATVAVTDSFRRTWQLVNQGVSRFDTEGVDVTALAVETRSPSGRVALVTPEAREYHGRNGQQLPTAILLRKETGGATHTMRVLLTATDSLDVAQVRVTFLPAPILWPIGVVMLGLSAMLALSVPESRLPSS
jgi:hypothetical protein